MGKSRRRQTAKTGDKGIYNKRDDASGNDKKKYHKDDGDDPIYDKVDQFHNQQDFLKLDQEENESDSEDELDRQEAVMDLGVGGDSSDDDDDEEEDSSSDEGENVPQRKQTSLDQKDSGEDDSEDEEGLSSDDDDGGDEATTLKSVRDWGRKKMDYYNGDTADLEIGQEEDDALVEEEAAKEIQAARYEQMKEEDFVLSDDDDDADDHDGNEAKDKFNATLDFKSKSEKIKFLDRKHPELLPLVSHFTDMLRDWKEQTNVVTRALLEGERGTTQVRARLEKKEHENTAWRPVSCTRTHDRPTQRP